MEKAEKMGYIREDGLYTDETKHLCPVCGKYEFPTRNSFDICEVCGWEDDSIQEENPDEEECANAMSLNQMRKAYKAGMTYYEAKDAWIEGKLK